MYICSVVDDALAKLHSIIYGKEVMGNRNDTKELVKKFNIEEILVVLPSVDSKERAKILSICKDIHCKLKSLPDIYELLNGDVEISKFKEVEVQNLLGRNPMEVNMEEIMGYVTDKIVMVTGGGGSISRELCRQIADKNPKQLIIFDIYENNAYNIQL